MMRGTLVVQSDCVPGRDDEFNRWYDETHAPETLQSDGFVSVQRYRAVDADRNGRHLVRWSRYLALYDIVATDLAAAYAGVRTRIARGELDRGDLMSAELGDVKVQLFELVDEIGRPAPGLQRVLLVQAESESDEHPPLERPRAPGVVRRYRAVESELLPRRDHDDWCRSLWIREIPEWERTAASGTDRVDASDADCRLAERLTWCRFDPV